MAIDNLPLPVVNFLNIIGVPWPYIDEDVVHQFASLTRDFGQAVQTTHDETTQAVQAISQAHQAQSTQFMASSWATMSNTEVSAIVAGCTALAAALDVAAGYIVAQKITALGVLVGMAAAFIGDQIAAVATFGLAEVAVPVIIAAAQRLVKSLVMTLEQYIIAEVIEAAAQPLFAKVQEAMAGLDWSKSGTPPTNAGDGFVVSPQAVATQTAALRTYAQQMLSQGQQYQTTVQGLNF